MSVDGKVGVFLGVVLYVAQSSGVPMTAQDGITGTVNGTITKSAYFSNITDAYKYMWKNSFNSEGHPSVEMSAFIIDNGGLEGVLVLPNNLNTIGTSRYDYRGLKGMEGIGFYVQDPFGGYSRITGIIHTHPSYNRGNIGISGADINTMEFFNVPMQVIWNDRVWQIHSRTVWQDLGINVGW